MAIKFFSFTTRPSRKPIPCGRRERVEHALRYDEYGNKYLAEVGSFDQYAFIQSFASSCDINEIIRRATPEQMSTFKAGTYGDVSNLPKTLADSYQLLRDVERIYSELPADVKSEYKDYAAFLNSFGNLNGAAEFVAKFTKSTNAGTPSDTAQSRNEEVIE